MEFIHKRFTNDHVEVEFKMDDILLSQQSNLDVNSICISVYIRKKSKILSLYSRTFPKNLSAVHYLNFVKKFLNKPSYRKPFLVHGFHHWDEVFQSPPPSIHPQCIKLIEELNTKATIKFKDLVQLKSFGTDTVSSMKIDKLKEVVSKRDYSFLLNESENEQIALSSLRWLARGLDARHALFKARVDAEIEQNKQKDSLK